MPALAQTRGEGSAPWTGPPLGRAAVGPRRRWTGPPLDRAAAGPLRRAVGC
jgi:hypothetical protein